MAAAATVVDAARAQALRWWPAAALAAAADRLRQAVEPWAIGWGLELGAVAASNAAGDHPGADAQPLAAGAVRLWHDGGPAGEAVACAMFGAAHAATSGYGGLAAEVSGQAWRELQCAIEAAAGDAAPAASIGPATSAWSGAVRIDFLLHGSTGPLRFCAWLSPACAAGWCAVPRPAEAASAVAAAGAARTPLVAVQAVLASRAVRLSVQLTPVELDLGSLQSLSVGDVIALPHRLDEPLQVTVDLGDAPSKTPWCRAHLAQRGGRLVAELAPGGSAH